MKIVEQILAKVESAGAQCVVVTKYLDKARTHEVLTQLQGHPAFAGVGENRIDQIIEKEIPREWCHFIGNIQSRKIPQMVEHCTVIHSVDQLRHAQTINKFVGENSNSRLQRTDIFLQINISSEPQKGGIMPEALPDFLEELPVELQIRGLSAIGAGDFTEAEKRAEFRRLRNLRDQYVPGGILSAGTSRDYEIALEEGVELVRVGRAFFE